MIRRGAFRGEFRRLQREEIAEAQGFAASSEPAARGSQADQVRRMTEVAREFWLRDDAPPLEELRMVAKVDPTGVNPADLRVILCPAWTTGDVQFLRDMKIGPWG